MKLNRVILYVLIAGFLLSATLASHNSFLLKTPHVRGVVSLELAMTNNRQSQILTEWKGNWAYIPRYRADSGYVREKVFALPMAIADTHYDYLFIVFYTGLLTYLILIGRKWYTGLLSFRAAAGLVVLAGLLDVTENIFMLQGMHAAESGNLHPDNAVLASIPSALKWLILAFSVGYYYRKVLRPQQYQWWMSFTGKLALLGAQLWRFRIVVIGLLVLFLLLNFVDQGTDLLIAINSTKLSMAIFLTLFVALATLNWYLPKLYDIFHSAKSQVTIRQAVVNAPTAAPSAPIALYIPRMIGSLTLIIPATGILNAMQNYHVNYLFWFISPMLLLFLLLFLYVQLIEFNGLDGFYKPGGIFKAGRYWLTFFVILALVTGGIFLNASDPALLAYLSLDFFLLSFLFFVTVTYRSSFQNSFGFDKVLAIVSLIAILFFLLFNDAAFSRWATTTDRFFSLPVIIAGIIFYTVISSYLLLIGRRIHFQLITIGLLLAFITSATKITPFHMVRTEPRAAKDSTTITLEHYVRSWLESRRGEITAQASQHREYPVFFVNAYGGGIKAAAWTTMVVGKLNDLFYKDTANSSAYPDFEHYAFSYSGASGGTIGLSLLAGARLWNPGDPLADSTFRNQNTLKGVFQHDYLTSDLAGILGRDYWMGSTGWDFYPDRAAISERSWEVYTYPYHIRYDQIIRTGWLNPKMEVPLFISNTYDIDGGVKAILAPVTLSPLDFPGVWLIQNQLKNTDIRLSSMAFLSARFPYVSPTGKFDEHHHYTDGGTIENSGAESSLQLVRVFKRVVESLDTVKSNPDDSVFKYIKICLLSIPNSIPQMDSVERVTNLYETSAPIMGILNTLGGNAMRADSENHVQAIRQKWNYYRMVPLDTLIYKGRIHPVLPLGWQLSDYAIDFMLASVNRSSHSEARQIQQYFRTQFPKQNRQSKPIVNQNLVSNKNR